MLSCFVDCMSLVSDSVIMAVAAVVSVAADNVVGADDLAVTKVAVVGLLIEVVTGSKAKIKKKILL